MRSSSSQNWRGCCVFLGCCLYACICVLVCLSMLLYRVIAMECTLGPSFYGPIFRSVACTACLHVSRIAEIDAALRGALIRAVLQRNHRLAGAQLLLAKVTDVLVRLLRADRRLAESVCLQFWVRIVTISQRDPQSTTSSRETLTLRPSDCRQITTEFRFWRSHRSTLWNVSCGGTPSCFAWSRKAVMFSMHLNAILLSLTRLIEPGLMQLISLHSRTPSLSTSKKLSVSPDVLIGSAVISLIHSSDSAASSSLYLLLIWEQQKNGMRFGESKRPLVIGSPRHLTDIASSAKM